METELLKVFDQQENWIGTDTRSEVHKAGYWHETFHCWLTERIGKEDFLFFQIRSSAKKDYPNLLDITAAGHILAEESPMDGLREVKEELGLDLALEDLHSLGVIKDSLNGPGFIDNELCHVFLHTKHQPFDNYWLQIEEVSGIMMASVTEFENLWFGKVREIKVEGFLSNGNNEKKSHSMVVAKNDFVTHEDTYIESIIKAIRNL